eukprot:jgi/Mesvir1/11680/Mv00073-RA.1
MGSVNVARDHQFNELAANGLGGRNTVEGVRNFVQRVAASRALDRSTANCTVPAIPQATRDAAMQWLLNNPPPASAPMNWRADLLGNEGSASGSEEEEARPVTRARARRAAAPRLPRRVTARDVRITGPLGGRVNTLSDVELAQITPAFQRFREALLVNNLGHWANNIDWCLLRQVNYRP